jgi:hypothetical protein
MDIQINQNLVKVIWERKKMTEKICAGMCIGFENLRALYDEAPSKYNYFIYIAPIGRESGRKITANISVYPSKPLTYDNGLAHYRAMVYGEADPHTGKISMQLNTYTTEATFEPTPYQEAIAAFKVGLTTFRDVFEQYIPPINHIQNQ